MNECNSSSEMSVALRQSTQGLRSPVWLYNPFLKFQVASNDASQYISRHDNSQTL